MELCSIVAQQRSQRRNREIPVQEVLASDPRSLESTQTAELLVRFPKTFPWLSDTKQQPTVKGHKDLPTKYDAETPE